MSPYSTKPINASSSSDETFLLALASGSAIHYDMTYEEAAELKDTEYDDLYYSNYEDGLNLLQNSIRSQMKCFQALQE